MLASHGHDVTGVDVNPEVVEAVNRAVSPISEPGIPELLRSAVRAGHLRAALTPEPSDVFIVAVPTPVLADKQPDMKYVHESLRAIGGCLRRGHLVVVESTVPPGATAGEITDSLEESGLKVGRDLHLAHCPERVLPGSITTEIVENDRIVGGVDIQSTKRAAELYRSFARGVIHETDATTAELVKLSENTYRDVNIALANVLANTAERLGVDSWRVIEMANRHPRVNIHRPGPGVGGHCIPVDPWFLVAAAPEETDIIRVAREVNDSQPARIAATVISLLGGRADRRASLLGVAYKAGAADTRGAPAIEIVARLRKAGVNVTAHDPQVRDFDPAISPLEEALADTDIAVVLTQHAEYRDVDPGHVRSLMRRSAVLDACNCLDQTVWERAGFRFVRYGDGRAPADTE